MKTRLALVPGFLMMLVSAACAYATDPSGSSDGYHPVDLHVGEIFKICQSGLIVCPATQPLCDDPKIAVPVDTPDGLGFKGVSPGTTLCTAYPTGGRWGSPHPVLRISVR